MATIFRRGNSWYLNLSEHGKRTVRSLGPNERLARLRLAEVESNIERGKAGFPVIEQKTLAWAWVYGPLLKKRRNLVAVRVRGDRAHDHGYRYAPGSLEGGERYPREIQDEGP